MIVGLDNGVHPTCSISANAAFMVVHELARRPHRSSVPDARCLELLDRVGEQLTHPLKDVLLDVARRMVRGECVSVDRCTELMQLVAAYPGQFNALAVVYFSCEDGAWEMVDHLYNAIIEDWKRPG